MSSLDRLERRFGLWAIPGLARVVASGMFLVFGLEYFNVVGREFFLLQADAVLAGQIWRILSFLMVPASVSPLFFLFETMILVLVGDALEEEWGIFRFNVYYMTGALFTIVLAFLMPEFPQGSYFLNLSLFLAFATLFPDFEFLVFFVLPVKVKYLAILSGLGIAWTVVFLPLPMKLAALTAVGNYLIFFGVQFLRGAQSRARLASRRMQTAALERHQNEPRHQCTICGKNDRTDPDLEFRYCTCPVCGPQGKAFCISDLDIHNKEKPA